MDILLVILGVICLLVGLAGCFLPVLPGPPVAYLALWLLQFRGRVLLQQDDHAVFLALVEDVHIVTEIGRAHV